uniref:histone acetyltransferase n=1 Tax=Dermatophagoides pteronyssinus TaxID=6956 RepID=A0A6P6Y5S8_DERPT
AKDEAYIHWKGYDRRLDSWVSWDNVKKFSLENLTKGYDPADIDSDGHGDVDKFYIKQHQANTKFRTISFVRLGQYEISTWYFSPYPREVQNIKTLLLCEFCLSFFKHEVEYERHASRCVARHPPGNEIYRNETNSVWEVDGGICKIYCENLCFLSKLFLDHKTLKHCVSLFMFYILTDICEDGFRIVGYFSKEKYSRNNLSCILVLPHCQRRGFGKFLISFSYALTLMQEIRGTPERPLSDLGRVSYYNFWKQCILHVLKDESEFTINELANELAAMFTYQRSLQELVDNRTISWIFVGGKGGVGKTTTSCSLAVKLAKNRESVLLVSTDPAHNVSDAFGQKFSNKPELVKGFANLYAMETDPNQYRDAGFSLENEGGKGFASMLPELISAFPGIDEAVSFGKLMNFIRSLSFTTIVFDTAPTGHTLRLLSFPSLLEKAFQSLGGGELSSAFEMFSSLTGAKGSEGFLDELRSNTKLVVEMFSDPTKTTFVCVCIPEFLSVYETERLILELTAREIDASYIVVNRVLFPLSGVACRMQSKYLEQIDLLYKDDFHVVAMPMMNDEVRGVADLETFGDLLLVERELPILEV